MNPIPHAFDLYGYRWKVVWGSKTDRDWKPQEDDALVNYETKEIIINPRLRGSRAHSWEALIHEVLHLIQRYEPGAMRRNSKEEKARIKGLEATYKKHAYWFRLDVPLGRFFAQAGASIPCVCKSCKKRKAKDKLKEGKVENKR